MHGGARHGSGRPVGSQNKRTRAAQDAAEASGLMPLDYLLSVMRDESNETALRVDAAHKAAPFLHPKLSSVQQAVTFPSGDPLGKLLQDVAVNGKRLGHDGA